MDQRRPYLIVLFFGILHVPIPILFDFAYCSTLQNTEDHISITNVSNATNANNGNNNNTIKLNEVNEFQKSDLKSNTSKTRLDNFFSMESSIFEKYMKNVNLSIIPGLRDDDDLENWVPPKQIQQDLPFYLAGFDFNNRPFWVIEYGKYNYSRYGSGGRKQTDLFEKYFRYFTYIAIKSRAIKSTDDHRINEHGFLIDFEGLDARNILNPKALRLQFKLITNYRNFAQTGCSKIICINLNHVSESLFRVGKSTIVSLSKVMEVYGTDKSKWVPVLLKNYPKDQLPEWYGGSKGFKPLYVLG